MSFFTHVKAIAAVIKINAHLTTGSGGGVLMRGLLRDRGQIYGVEVRSVGAFGTQCRTGWAERQACHM